MMASQKERSLKLQEKFAELLRAYNMTGSIQAVLCSRPGELIVELADRERCTMIVMGSRGLGMLRRTIMGSVSDYVLHHAHCPVVICTHQHQDKQHHSQHHHHQHQQQQQQPQQQQEQQQH
jgi:nucleotide-binding universal stress UspA family protein